MPSNGIRRRSFRLCASLALALLLTLTAEPAAQPPSFLVASLVSPGPGAGA